MIKKISNNKILINNKGCVILTNCEKSVYLQKFLKNKINLNIFFNINDSDDDLFYLYYDVFYWTINKKWYLFRPHYLSFFFCIVEALKWRYVRLINNTNKKKNINILFKSKVNNNIWMLWFSQNKELLKKKLNGFYSFKLQLKNFKFKQYYFFFNNINLLIFYFDYSLNPMYYILILNFYNFIFNYKNLKKDNKKYIYIIFSYFLYNLCDNFWSLKYRLSYILTIHLLFIKNNLTIFLSLLIKEKHKLKNFLLQWCFLNYIFKVRELQVFLGLRSKKRLRRKKDEKKLILKKKNFFKRKKRTNNQILKALIKKYILRKNLYYWVFKKNHIFNKFYLQLKFNYFNLSYFFIFKFKYIDTLFFDIDGLYVYYLPKMYKWYSLDLLTDDFSDLWRGTYTKKIIYSNKLTKNFNNIIGNINLYNKLTIKQIYKNLFITNKRILKQSKKYFLIQNILILIRFYKNNFLVLKNFDFIFNIYFWFIIFFNCLKKSKYIIIKKIMDYTSFLLMLDLLYKNKYNWFNLSLFDIFLNIITYNNEIIKLKCSFEFLLQEVCLYLFFLFFTEKSIILITKNDIKKKIKQIKDLQNIEYVIKGNLNFENNYLLCLNIIKKSLNNKYFIDLINNFFINCKNSINFIKCNLKLYWSLLELSYSSFDKYNLNLLINLNLNKEIFYFRYKNIILFCADIKKKEVLEFIFKNFILYFLYYYLQFYFFFCTLINLKVNNLIFFGYIFYLKNNKLKIKLDNFEILKLLIYYNFLQIHEKKLKIKISKFLLSYSVLRILNYFFTIWLELLFYYQNLNIKSLLKYKQFLLKNCLLTIFLKLKKKQKIINLLYLKNIFNLRINKINNKKLNNYVLKNNKLNFKNIFNENLLK